LLGYPDADNIDAVQTNIEEALDQMQIPAEIMNVAQTSATLSAKGINKSNIHSNTIEDLASALGVDALFIGQVNSASNGNANMKEIVLQLVEGSTGQIVWNASKDIVMTASTEKFPVGKN